jgi:hypothetical protein
LHSYSSRKLIFKQNFVYAKLCSERCTSKKGLFFQSFPGKAKLLAKQSNARTSRGKFI